MEGRHCLWLSVNNSTTASQIVGVQQDDERVECGYACQVARLIVY